MVSPRPNTVVSCPSQRIWGKMERLLQREGLEVLRCYLADDGTFPNNSEYPSLIFPKVIQYAQQHHASDKSIKVKDQSNLLEQISSTLLSENGWTDPWAWGVFTYHHYHSTAWEALICIRGSATIQFGGPAGLTVDTSEGDYILIPPGVVHKQVNARNGFTLLGSYPLETPDVDTLTSSPTKEQLQNIEQCLVPRVDPIFGTREMSWGHFSSLF